MAVIPWTIKKQLMFLSIFALIVIIIIFFIWKVSHPPTCSDNKQNQKEEGIDCGGPCKLCLGEIRDLIVVWSKTFRLKEGVYEVAALVENSNLTAGLPSLKYKLRAYDENNVLLTMKEGETFINPDDRFLILEGIFETNRIPKRAFAEFEENLNWQRIEKEKPQIIVSSKQFFNEPTPRLVVKIDNKSIFPVKEIFTAAILYDENKNAIAVSTSKADLIKPNSSTEVVFTWPEPLGVEPASSDVLLRTDLVH